MREPNTEEKKEMVRKRSKFVYEFDKNTESFGNALRGLFRISRKIDQNARGVTSPVHKNHGNLR